MHSSPRRLRHHQFLPTPLRHLRHQVPRIVSFTGPTERLFKNVNFNRLLSHLCTTLRPVTSRQSAMLAAKASVAAHEPARAALVSRRHVARPVRTLSSLVPLLVTGPVGNRQPAAIRRSGGSPAVDFSIRATCSIRAAAPTQVAARSKKASLLPGSLADSAQDRH